MSELKSRPPAKKIPDNLEAFISGAAERTAETASVEPETIFPWQEPGIREDVLKIYNLRLPEPYLLKLKYIAEHTPNSMQKFCLNVIQEAIDAEIENLTK
jgi:hypothetical protein